VGIKKHKKVGKVRLTGGPEEVPVRRKVAINTAVPDSKAAISNSKKKKKRRGREKKSKRRGGAKRRFTEKVNRDWKHNPRQGRNRKV